MPLGEEGVTPRHGAGVERGQAGGGIGGGDGLLRQPRLQEEHGGDDDRRRAQPNRFPAE